MSEARPPPALGAAIDAALGAGGPEQRRAAATERLANAGLDALIEAIEHDLAPIAAALPPIAPPEGLFARIETALDADIAAHQGARGERFGEGGWSTVAPGVAIKPLWDGMTFLMRCAAGAIVPSHPHAAYEHTVVISGDLIVGETEYLAGDYHGIEAGRSHPPLRTRTGCVILLRYQ